jgi:hypothetical protein
MARHPDVDHQQRAARVLASELERGIPLPEDTTEIVNA